MWDDPLFTSQASIDEWELKDEELIDLRRQDRLLALELVHRQRNEYRRSAGYWYWCFCQLGRRMHRDMIASDQPDVKQRGHEHFMEFAKQLEIDAQVQETLGFDFGAYFDNPEEFRERESPA